jgi:predicted nucleic acid-binding Zn ribbon protein
MPTYNYKCSAEPDNKEHLYSEDRSMNDPSPEDLICKFEGCGAKLIRIFAAPPIQFKGAGFSTNKPWR